eukprot:CAMPEP_0194574482 /NCGR_PEP_ID=MMETSP0292-20121207/10315_1 /TAXON_ID=39354 /ORGANISM="Heterosigma akashiwo, Strain CCMP2393" /LENGTH=82 /DNA_ID=CAMNT_0039426011 /DNA_START=239 /DNA_END=487 /DNA_ORIENTATION=-
MDTFMDSYLENAMGYVQETFESANVWMKENDPFPNFGLPGAEAGGRVRQCHKLPNGDEVCVWVDVSSSGPPNGGGVGYHIAL